MSAAVVDNSSTIADATTAQPVVAVTPNVINFEKDVQEAWRPNASKLRK